MDLLRTRKTRAPRNDNQLMGRLLVNSFNLQAGSEATLNEGNLESLQQRVGRGGRFEIEGPVATKICRGGTRANDQKETRERRREKSHEVSLTATRGRIRSNYESQVPIVWPLEAAALFVTRASD